MTDSLGATILYIEDDAGLARLLKKRLERLDCLVEVACDGAEGLSRISQGIFDTVLIDYDLPGLTGIEVLRRLRDTDAPPVVMLTGHGNERVAVEAMKLGAADYLVKDVELRYLELLPLVIQQVLQRTRLAKERQEIVNEVRESEERYRRLVELCPDGISVHCQGRLEFINGAGARILGAERPEELLGRPIIDFVHPDCRQDFGRQQELCLQGVDGMPWTVQRFLRCDRGEVEVEMTALPMTLDGKSACQTIFRDISERRASQQRLERMAKYDLLTGLPNRSFLSDRLNRLLLKARREGGGFALLFLDLDRFKNANDRYGHDFGDLLLREVALRLTSCLGDADTAARVGGDEFVVLVPWIRGRAEAAVMAQRISAALARPYLIQGCEVTLGASIGISLFPEDGETKELQLTRADAAMYRCKRSGQPFQFYSPEAGGSTQRTTRSGDQVCAEPAVEEPSRTVA